MATTSGSSPDRVCPHVANVDITELYCPEPTTEILADIVFVHGLMGHPRRTWLYGEGSKHESLPAPESSVGSRRFSRLFGKKSKIPSATEPPLEVDSDTGQCFWPHDLLAKDVSMKSTRVLTYGYGSHPTHFYRSATNRMTISQHARDLMSKLAIMRSHCQGRPLIFIAHSLGGILVKGALNESQHMVSQPACLDLKRSCHAIIFMGTPHQGADIASWGEMLINIVGALPGGFSTDSRVIRELAPEGEVLSNISRRFNEYLNEYLPAHEKIQICSVQEGRGKSGMRGWGSKACYLRV